MTFKMHISLLLVVCCASVCMANYEYIEGFGYYRFHSEKLTYPRAQKKCVEEGGYLAEPNSAREAAKIKEYFQRMRRPGDSHMTLVGFNDINTEGVYMTSRGRSMSTMGYNVWKNPPSTQSAQNQARDCGIMWTCGRLGDTMCDEPHTFMCEKDAEEEDLPLE